MRTWRDDLPTNRCRHCGERFRVSQEALDEARECGSTGTDAEIADSLDTCLSCSCEEDAPGEKVYTLMGGAE